MLDDNNTINDFNPFVQRDISLPGARRKPQEFDRHPLPRQISDDPFESKRSVMCDYGITVGSKTIDMCRPKKSDCPLSRPLIPGRNIDRGFTTTTNTASNIAMETLNRTCGISLPIIVIMFLILLIAIR